MRVGDNSRRLSGSLRGTTLVAVAVLVLLGAAADEAMAATRVSANYAMTIDAITAGGGAGAAVLHRLPDSAVGQAACGPAASGAYRERAGVVQAWAAPGEPPVVTGLMALSVRSFRMTFSKPMGAGVTDPANYTLTGDGGEGTLNPQPDSVALAFDTNYDLLWNTGSTVAGGTATITVNPSVQDAEGIAMGVPNSGTCATLGPALPGLHVPAFAPGRAQINRDRN